MKVKAPAGLGKSGKALWAQFVELAELGAGEPALLEHACRGLDELDQLSNSLRGAEVVVDGSTGQPRVNPLYEEIRRHRASVAALLKQVQPQADAGHVDVGAAMSEVAYRRWHGPRVVGR